MEELNQLVSVYRPSDTVVDFIRSTRIVLLVGISGAGKDTIKHEIAKSPNFFQIISHTTRSPRVNNAIHEANGIDYHFIDTNKAVDMLKKRDFIEAKLVHGDTVYGTAVSEFEKASKLNQVAIADVDVQGVDEYLNLSSHIKAIFIVPPSYDIWIERLKKRYANQNDFDAEWPKRRSSAEVELIMALDRSNYHFVINDKLDRTIEMIDQLVYEPSLIVFDDESARQTAKIILAELKSRA